MASAPFPGIDCARQPSGVENCSFDRVDIPVGVAVSDRNFFSHQPSRRHRQAWAVRVRRCSCEEYLKRLLLPLQKRQAWGARDE